MPKAGTSQPPATGEPAADDSPCGSTRGGWSVDPADLDAAHDDERCIYALDSRDGSVFTLPDNALVGEDKKALRLELDEFMRCLGCGNPITARHYIDRRDHFFHARKVPGCSRTGQVEGAWHLLSKLVLREWLTSLGFRAREEVWSRDRAGRADVLAWVREALVGDVDEAVVAFEVQYTALGETAWSDRHATWASEPATDVWLFGHHGHNHRIPGAGQHVTLNTAHQAVITSGQPLLWINPLDRTIGTALVERSHRGQRYLVPPDGNDQRVTVEWAPFGQCAVTRDGISHPSHQRGLDSLAELARVRQLPLPEHDPDTRMRGPGTDRLDGPAGDSGHQPQGVAAPPSTWEQLWIFARRFGAIDPMRVHYVHNREPLPIDERMKRWRDFKGSPAAADPVRP